MEFEQDADLALAPMIGWAMTERPAGREQVRRFRGALVIKHNETPMKNFLVLFVLLMGSALLVPFGAAKTAQTPSVSGKWHFVFDTQGGDRTFDATFQQDGEQVSGKWDSADVKGTFSEGKLTLEFPYNSQEVGPGTLKLKGTLGTDGALSGDWAFADYSGSFKATRVKE